jgi:hypothetical protein
MDFDLPLARIRSSIASIIIAVSMAHHNPPPPAPLASFAKTKQQAPMVAHYTGRINEIGRAGRVWGRESHRERQGRGKPGGRKGAEARRQGVGKKKRKLDDITEPLVSPGPSTCGGRPQGTPQGQAVSDNLEGGATKLAQRLRVHLGGKHYGAAPREKQMPIALLLFLTIRWMSWQQMSNLHRVCDVREACVVKPMRFREMFGHLGAATHAPMKLLTTRAWDAHAHAT